MWQKIDAGEAGAARISARNLRDSVGRSKGPAVNCKAEQPDAIQKSHRKPGSPLTPLVFAARTVAPMPLCGGLADRLCYEVAKSPTRRSMSYSAKAEGAISSRNWPLARWSTASIRKWC